MNKEEKHVFSEPVRDIMSRRVSVRSYAPEPVPKDLRHRISAYFDALKGPFEPGTRFMLLDKAGLKASENIRLGTYGFIRGAPLFAAAAVENGPRAMEQLGYVFEKLICYITSLGLGTCWLGGTFKKSAFEEALRLEPGELLPAVAAVGYPADTRTLVDFALNPSGKTRKRKRWQELFFTGTFGQPLSARDAGPYATPLEMVRIAPSASNKQPWRIVRENGDFHFYLKHNMRYSRVYGFDMQKIDMGIAMFHFESSAREAGLQGGWQETRTETEGVPEGAEYIITWGAKRHE